MNNSLYVIRAESLQTLRRNTVIVLKVLILVLLMAFYIRGEGKEILSSLEDYDMAYKDISSRTNQPVGIVIIAFNRPHCFKGLIESLEKNAESQTLPFYFVLDGGPRATQKENVDIINQSSIKHKEIILRPRNFGCPKTVIDAHRFMFDWCGFKKIIYLQEDLIVSPFYIKLILNLHEWATSNYSNVGIVSCWSYCFLSKEEKVNKLAFVQEPPIKYWWSLLTYCLDSNVWNDIKSILYEYERFIDEIPHTEEFAKARSKPHCWVGAPKIYAWVTDLCSRKIEADKNFSHFQFHTVLGKALFPNVNIYKTIRNHYSKKQNSKKLVGISEDHITIFSLWIKGYMKIETVVNRLIHTGDEGITMNPKLIHLSKINDIKLDIFDQDKDFTMFKQTSN